MDDGRSVLIPSFLFLFCPCPIRFAFGMPVSSASGSSASFRAFPASFRTSRLCFRIFVFGFELFLSVFGFAVFLSGFFRCQPPAAGAFSPFSGNCFLPPRSCRPVSAAPFLPPRSCRPGPAARSCRPFLPPVSVAPFLPPGLPFYLFAALSVRNRRWILPMRRSSEDCPAMPVQYVDTHCIYSCIAAVWAGCVSDCAGSSMLPNC